MKELSVEAKNIYDPVELKITELRNNEESVEGFQTHNLEFDSSLAVALSLNEWLDLMNAIQKLTDSSINYTSYEEMLKVDSVKINFLIKH